MFRGPTPVVTNILIINIIVFLLQLIFSEVEPYLILEKVNWVIKRDPDLMKTLPEFNFIQWLTYAFMHGGFLHILFNSIALYGLGSMVEMTIGSRRFIEFYLICAIGAGIVTSIFDPNPYPVLGASAAIAGVAIAFAVLYPNNELILFPIPIPIRAKYLIWGSFVISFVLGVVLPLINSGYGDGISHFGHFAGMLVAAIYVAYFRYLKR
ncbi:MAG: rhomboid family intramembrane serine protease [Bacteroidia bacterium]|nr:rhomboid family intramembrane serine protease [Bacteroidia bacterium]